MHFRLSLYTFYLLLILCNFTYADNPPSFYTALSALDAEWNLNFTSQFGAPNLACNCSNNTLGGSYPCLWLRNPNEGFFCSSGVNAVITKIQFLSPIGGDRAISTHLLSFTTLTELILINSDFASSPLPDFTPLTQLQVLQINNNNLVTPLSLLPNSIINVNLANNSLLGVIPTSYSTLPLLQSLDLSNNQLAGYLTITNVVTLNVANNQLFGTLPLFGNNLKYIDVANNTFTGSLNSTLLLTLSECEFDNNNFSPCGLLVTTNHNCSISCSYSLCTPQTPPIFGAICTPINSKYYWYTTNTNLTGISLTDTLIVDGNVTQDNNSVIIINISANNASNPYLEITGDIVVSGTLIINITNVVNSSLISANQIHGNFTNIKINNIPQCTTANVHSDGATLQLLLNSNDNCNSAKSLNKTKYVIIGCTIAAAVIIIAIGIVIYWQYPHIKAFRVTNEEKGFAV